MPKIDPFVGLFVPIATLNIGMFMWVRDAIANDERVARIEGTVAGAHDRLFPEHMA